MVQRSKRQELPDSASPWALLQRARAAQGLRSARAAESELTRLYGSGLITRDQLDAGEAFLRLRRSVVGWEAPSSPLATLRAADHDPADADRTEATYRGALAAIGSPARLAALQHAVADDRAPLTLRETIAVRDALSALAAYLGSLD